MPACCADGGLSCRKLVNGQVRGSGVPAACLHGCSRAAAALDACHPAAVCLPACPHPQNFREAQDRQGRPILFHAAAGVCDAGLARLPSDGILSRMLGLDDSGSSSLSLQQYSLLAAANLTAGGANCAQSR